MPTTDTVHENITLFYNLNNLHPSFINSLKFILEPEPL